MMNKLSKNKIIFNAKKQKIAMHHNKIMLYIKDWNLIQIKINMSCRIFTKIVI